MARTHFPNLVFYGSENEPPSRFDDKLESRLILSKPLTGLARTLRGVTPPTTVDENFIVSEHAFFMKSAWLKEGFSLLKQHAGYKRDYLMPRLNADGGLEQKPAGYAGAIGGHRGTLGDRGPSARAARLLSIAGDRCCPQPSR